MLRWHKGTAVPQMSGKKWRPVPFLTVSPASYSTTSCTKTSAKRGSQPPNPWAFRPTAAAPFSRATGSAQSSAILRHLERVAEEVAGVFENGADVQSAGGAVAVGTWLALAAVTVAMAFVN